MATSSDNLALSLTEHVASLEGGMNAGKRRPKPSSIGRSTLGEAGHDPGHSSLRRDSSLQYVHSVNERMSWWSDQCRGAATIKRVAAAQGTKQEQSSAASRLDEGRSSSCTPDLSQMKVLLPSTRKRRGSQQDETVANLRSTCRMPRSTWSSSAAWVH
jgi:hypothetical protein